MVSGRTGVLRRVWCWSGGTWTTLGLVCWRGWSEFRVGGPRLVLRLVLVWRNWDHPTVHVLARVVRVSGWWAAFGAGVAELGPPWGSRAGEGGQSFGHGRRRRPAPGRVAYVTLFCVFRGVRRVLAWDPLAFQFVSAQAGPASSMRKWRNRQTRTVQVRVPERAWGFNSPLAHRGPSFGRSERGPFPCAETASKRVSMRPEQKSSSRWPASTHALLFATLAG